MNRQPLQVCALAALTGIWAVSPVFGQGRGGRGDALVPTALIAERNLKPDDFPTLRSTTGNVYVWEDVQTLGFLTNDLIVITGDGVLVADGQASPEATKKMVDAIHLLTP